MKPICIIPARSGSKRIKNKNIKLFFGKPIIYYSIKAAIKSKCFSDIFVSTDSIKIKRISEKFGAKVRFLRPKNLSGDKVHTRPVISHAIKSLYPDEHKPKYICYMSSTCPFVSFKDIKKGFELIKKKKINFAFTVSTFDYPLQRALKLTKKKRIKMLNPKFRNSRSQDLETFFHDAGQFYWAKTDAVLKNLNTFDLHSMPIIIDRFRAIDIDTPEDWKQAELMGQYLIKK